MTANELQRHINEALQPNAAFVKSIDHGEYFDIQIKSPKGDSLFIVEAVSRESVLSVQQLQTLIRQLKSHIE